MAQPFVIGVDVGTSGCKVVAVDKTGAVLASFTETYPIYTPIPGWTEQDSDDWYAAACRALKKLGEKVDFSDAKAIGFSGQMHGMVALGEDLRPLRRAILWNDQRTQRQCDEIVEAVGGEEELLAITNNRMLTGFTGGKIKWMQETEPWNYTKTAVILNPKDYVRLRMTGAACTDETDASGFGLFDVKNRQWPWALTWGIGVPRSILPKVVQSVDVVGGVTAEAAAETGLPEGLPVVAGGGDAVISTTGMGIALPGRVGVTLGTSGVVAKSLSEFMYNKGGKLQVNCDTKPGAWQAFGCTLNAAGSYQWFRDTFAPDMEFSHLDKLAADCPAGSAGLLFLPYLNGERAPVNDPKATGTFVGITAAHTLGHFARAVMEGVAYSLYEVFKAVDDGTTAEIVTAGGGAKSPLWRQILADVFGLPVYTVTGAAEGGAYGAALVAGSEGRLWDSLDEALQTPQKTSCTTPDHNNAETYRRQFARYCKLYPALKNI